MLVKIIRSLRPEEVKERIDSFEDEVGMAFGDFKDKFLRMGRPRERLKTYIDWASLVDAYRGYEESGELDYTLEDFCEFKSNQLCLLTPKRIELLYTLASIRVGSISELARKIKRNIKNVHHDLRVLESLGLLILEKRGKRNIVPVLLIEEFTFLFG